MPPPNPFNESMPLEVLFNLDITGCLNDQHHPENEHEKIFHNILTKDIISHTIIIITGRLNVKVREHCDEGHVPESHDEAEPAGDQEIS